MRRILYIHILIIAALIIPQLSHAGDDDRGNAHEEYMLLLKYALRSPRMDRQTEKEPAAVPHSRNVEQKKKIILSIIPAPASSLTLAP